MRAVIGVALAWSFLAVAPATQTAERADPSSDSLERTFESGGRVRMNLSAGEYVITGTSENRVRLEWRVRDPERLWRVKARADVQGSRATIETDGGDGHGLHGVIRVPARSDLDIRLTAGELRIEGIDGNKDVDLYAGEVNIDVRRAADYRSVDASVWAGEIDARPFSASKGGLFRSVAWTGTGPYRLRVKLWAGEIRLFTTGAAASR
jgi:hypothetical protein